jgi:hypothetical protein
MKRHRSAPRTFRDFERLADGPRGYVAPGACDGCGTSDDDDHATWCRTSGNGRAVQFAAHFVAGVNESLPGDAAARSDEPDAEAPSRARRTHTSRSSVVRRDPASDGRAPR